VPRVLTTQLLCAMLVLAACGSQPSAAPQSTAGAAKPSVTSAQPASSPAGESSEREEQAGRQVKLGNVTFNDHGTQDVSRKSSLEVEADNYYFGPTFLKGTPGQKMKLTVGNDTGTEHNFSAPAVNMDVDAPANKDTEIEVTFPQSGTLYFFCKYHRQLGMNGELLVGNASPQAPSSVAAAPAQSNGGSAY
jgi:plastocyanin